MFNTVKEKVLVGSIVALIILIPAGSFLISQRFKAQQATTNSANRDLKLGNTITQPKEVPNDSPLNSLNPSAKPSTDSGSSLSLTGPNLAFKLNLQGRPSAKQSTQLFVGIAQGEVTAKPQYLLSFNINIPDSGTFSGLSLAGLSQFETYTAYLKGTSQIATSSAFMVKPTTTDIGTIQLLTGDVNEDNIINSADYSVVKSALGSIPGATNWNANLDFNLDNMINNFDIAYIFKNFGLTGASGPWYSRPPATPVSSQSGTLKPFNIGGPAEATSEASNSSSIGGYWMWVPKID